MRVFVIAEVRCYREGLAFRLASEAGCAVAGTATSVASAIRDVHEAQPDVVLVDVAEPLKFDAIRTLAATSSPARIVALALPETERDVVACAEAGIAGYVPPDASIADLLVTLRKACDGEVSCPPRIAAGLFRRLAALAAEDYQSRTSCGVLTRRETEILGFIDQGLSNKEIARRLQIEVPTVKNHVHHILEKLNVHSRGEAAARARGRATTPSGLFESTTPRT